MKRRCLNNGGREKAFWGAVIPAVASLIGAGISAASQTRNSIRAMEEQKRLQQRELAREQTEQAVKTVNNYLSSITPEEEEYVYANGGKRRLRNAGVTITDGGPILNLSTGELKYPGDIVEPGKYKNLGVKHNHKNAQGGEGTGWITSNGKTFETERDEVDIVRPNEVMVFSDRAKKNGISYADRALFGENPDNLMREQLQDKHRRLRNGGHTNKRNKALWGASFTTPDYIGLGTNVAASILSGIWANRGYDNLLRNIDYSLPNYVDETYVSGPTNWNNTAQRAEVRRAQLMGRRNMGRNTASSSVSLNRGQELDTNAMYELNKLWDEEANKETEMRQENARRQQDTRARNAAARNEYYRKVADIRNQQLATRLGVQEGKLKSNVDMIQGIGSSIGNFLQQGIDNYQSNQARLIELAKSQYGTPERMASFGVRFNNNEMRNLMNDAEYMLNNYKDDNTKEGIKTYNDALDRYNFWRNRLGITGESNYSRRTIANGGKKLSNE